MQTFGVCSTISNRELCVFPQRLQQIRQDQLRKLANQLSQHLQRDQWTLLKISEECYKCADYDRTELRTLIDIGDIRYVDGGHHTFLAKPVVETRVRYVKEQLTLVEMARQLPTAVAAIFGLNESQFYRIVLLLVATLLFCAIWTGK